VTSSRDRRIADDAGAEFALRCRARGCPCAWSIDLGEHRKLCSAHALCASPAQWPLVTEQLVAEETERARGEWNTSPAESAGLTQAAAVAILKELRGGQLFRRSPTKAWAHALRDAERAGRSLSSFQRRAWRAALGEGALGSVAAHYLLDQAAAGASVEPAAIAEALRTTGDLPA
jgi:hypothetical protein